MLFLCLSDLFFLVIGQGTVAKPDIAQRVQELDEYTTALENETANLHTLRKLIILCHQNAGPGYPSPPLSPLLLSMRSSNGVPMSPLRPSPGPTHTANSGSAMLGDTWGDVSRFEKLFTSLCNFLRPNMVRIFSSNHHDQH